MEINLLSNNVQIYNNIANNKNLNKKIKLNLDILKTIALY